MTPPNPDRSAVTMAIAELIGCTYLDAVPTPAENDHMREVAANAREAMDRLVADAARWRKVAPLIERLRHTRRHAKPGFVVKALDNLLAATEDAP